jgi:K+ transporter
MKCLKCGTDNIDSANFCSKCGIKLGSVEKKNKHKVLNTIITIILVAAIVFVVNTYRHERQVEQANAYAAAAEQAKQEQMMNNKPPVSLDGCTLYKDEFGNFVIHLKVKNISDKQIDGYKAVIACKNHFDEPVKPADENDNLFKGQAERIIEAGDYDKKRVGWTLYGFRDATKFDVAIVEVHFTDGTEWKQDEQNVVQYGIELSK